MFLRDLKLARLNQISWVKNSWWKKQLIRIYYTKKYDWALANWVKKKSIRPREVIFVTENVNWKSHWLNSSWDQKRGKSQIKNQLVFRAK